MLLLPASALLVVIGAVLLEAVENLNPTIDFGDIPNLGNAGNLNLVDEKVELHVTAHHPCLGRPNKFEKIRFPRIQLAPLRKNPANPDCYYLTGPVQIWSELSEDDMEIYVEMRASLDPDEPPVSCMKADSITEQYYGSCVYKQPCAYETTHAEQRELAQVKITRTNSVPLQCGEKLPPGLHRDLELHFCPPTRLQFMNMASNNPQVNSSWTLNTNNLLERYQLDNKLNFYMRVIVFNFDITDMFNDQQSVEKFQRRILNLNVTQQLPAVVRARLPFNRFMSHTDNFVGCHVMLGDVVLNPIKQPQQQILSGL